MSFACRELLRNESVPDFPPVVFQTAGRRNVWSAVTSAATTRDEFVWKPRRCVAASDVPKT